MADLRAQLTAELTGLQAMVSEVDYDARGCHLEVEVAPDRVPDMARIFLENEFYIVFVTAVHAQPALEVIYQFAHHGILLRCTCRTRVAGDGTVPSIAPIFQGADWHERETRDLFGVVFSGHPNLIPLVLSDEDADLKPLLKGDDKVKPVEALRPRENQPAEAGDSGKPDS